jgi:transposase
LSDAAWAVIEPLMPVRDLRKGGARRKYGDRLVLNAVLFVLRSGCQWRMIPRDLLPWDPAYRWFATWRKDGTWDRMPAGRAANPRPDAAHQARWVKPRTLWRAHR